MNYPRISIVTPSYNQGEYLEETILSVLEQNYPNLQYIIMDGGSNDNSVEIIKKYAKYLDYWVSQKDKGQSDAINKGFEKCNGQIFNWLCSDDYYEKDTFNSVSSIYEETGAKVISGKIRYVYNDSSKNKIYKGTQIYGSTSECIGKSINIQPSTFFDKECLNTIFPLNISLHYAMDQEFWIRYLLTFGCEDIKTTDKIYTNFRIHDNSKTATLYPIFKQDEYRIFDALALKIKAHREHSILSKYLESQSLDYKNDEYYIHDNEILKGIKYYLMNRNEFHFFKDNFGYALQNINYCDIKKLVKKSKIYKKYFEHPDTL